MFMLVQCGQSLEAMATVTPPNDSGAPAIVEVELVGSDIEADIASQQRAAAEARAAQEKADMKRQIDRYYPMLKRALSGVPVNAETIGAHYVLKIAVILSEVNNIPGHRKRAIATGVLIRVIEGDSTLTQDEKDMLKMSIDGFLVLLFTNAPNNVKGCMKGWCGFGR